MIIRPSSVLFLVASLLFLASCQELGEQDAAGDDANTSTTTDASTTSSSSTSSSEASTSSSEAPCVDDPNTDCASFKDFCTNDKYIPLLKAFCPVTCNFCPGATTAAPTTANPNCYDSSSNCKNWANNGFCKNCFYKCSDRIKYCAKTCGYCSAGACKDCSNMQSFMKFVNDNSDLLA